jgi:glycosyltransferase involved in cell wall biosynthesis
MEIILVDDGSDDGSGAIIDELAQEDPRILVIHQENKGVSAARNSGLKLAQGKYLMFVDGDDYVEPDYVAYFVSLIENNCTDMAVGRKAFEKKDSVQIVEDHIKTVDAEDVIEGIYLNHFGVAVWNKIYRHDIVKKIGLTFNPEFWYGEGMLFNILYLQYAETAAIGERRVYHVRENPASATRYFKLENQYCGLRSMEFQKANWIKETIGIKTAWEYHYRMYARHILQGLMTSGKKKQNRRLYRKCIRILRTNLRVPLQANLSARMKVNSILMAICPTGFIRDEIGLKRDKGDPFDFIPLRLLSLARRSFAKIPAEKKASYFNRKQARLRAHYRPTYLEKKLL